MLTCVALFTVHVVLYNRNLTNTQKALRNIALTAIKKTNKIKTGLFVIPEFSRMFTFRHEGDDHPCNLINFYAK